MWAISSRKTGEALFLHIINPPNITRVVSTAVVDTVTFAPGFTSRHRDPLFPVQEERSISQPRRLHPRPVPQIQPEHAHLCGLMFRYHHVQYLPARFNQEPLLAGNIIRGRPAHMELPDPEWEYSETYQPPLFVHRVELPFHAYNRIKFCGFHMFCGPKLVPRTPNVEHCKFAHEEDAAGGRRSRRHIKERPGRKAAAREDREVPPCAREGVQ